MSNNRRQQQRTNPAAAPKRSSGEEGTPAAPPASAKRAKVTGPESGTGAASASTASGTLKTRKEYEEAIARLKAEGGGPMTLRHRQNIKQFIEQSIVNVQARAGEDDYLQIMDLLNKEGKEYGADFQFRSKLIKKYGQDSFESFTYWLHSYIAKCENGEGDRISHRSRFRKAFSEKRAVLDKLFDENSGNGNRKYLEVLKLKAEELEKHGAPSIAVDDRPAHAVARVEQYAAEITKLTCQIFKGEEDIRTLWNEKDRIRKNLNNYKVRGDLPANEILKQVRSGDKGEDLKERLKKVEEDDTVRSNTGYTVRAPNSTPRTSPRRTRSSEPIPIS